MYNIVKYPDHLRVIFETNFDYTTMNAIIHHVTTLEEYPHTNDLWLIGTCHADIRLGELDTMVKNFRCRCPADATRTKTAVVAERGLTRSILELWIKALNKKISFEIRMFTSLEEAESWLQLKKAQVA